MFHHLSVEILYVCEDVQYICSVKEQSIFLSCCGFYRFVCPGCDVYPASSLPCWKRPARSLVKWPFSSPTGWGPGRTRIRSPPTLGDTHRTRPIIQLLHLILIMFRPNQMRNSLWFRPKQTHNMLNHRVNLCICLFLSTDSCCWFTEGLHSLDQHTHTQGCALPSAFSAISIVWTDSCMYVY